MEVRHHYLGDFIPHWWEEKLLNENIVKSVTLETKK